MKSIRGKEQGIRIERDMVLIELSGKAMVVKEKLLNVREPVSELKLIRRTTSGNANVHVHYVVASVVLLLRHAPRA